MLTIVTAGWLLLDLITTTAYAAPSSQYIRDTRADLVIVFVHGVFGDSISTWTSENNAYWPTMITQDSEFDGADVFVYQYPTRLGTRLSIDELADDVNVQLAVNKVSNYKNIIFISHSMGGLVTRAYLLKHREIATKVRFLFFLSTPTTGSEIASYAQLLLSNPQLAKMEINVAEEYLGDQIRAWDASGFNIVTYCAYETKPIYGFKVVTFESATALCSNILAIDANHVDIAKPVDAKASSYVFFKLAYRESSKKTDLRFKNFIERVQFGDTSLSFAAEKLRYPTWEKERLARFDLGGPVAFVEHSGEYSLSKQLIQYQKNRILGAQIYLDQVNNPSVYVAIGYPPAMTEGVSPYHLPRSVLGRATFKTSGLLDRLGTSDDPLTNRFYCAEMYGDDMIGLCCRDWEVERLRVTIVKAWADVHMPQNWAPAGLDPVQRLIARLIQNDTAVHDLDRNWTTRTETQSCYGNHESDDVLKRLHEGHQEFWGYEKPDYEDVDDAKIRETMSNVLISGISFYDGDIRNRTPSQCLGKGCYDVQN
jgi:pimeloyl-ACP methyl ester carboxylesterase